MKKSTGTAIVGGMFVALVGAAAFIFSRPAAAKAKADKAFAVDPFCGSILVINEDEAKGALLAAAIAVSPTPDSNALEALKAIMAFMFPKCDWVTVPDNRTFVRGFDGGEQHLTWADIKAVVGDRTVAELKDLLKDMGVMQGASPTEPTPWVVSSVFGTGGCIECAMGTGAETRSKQGYTIASDRAKGHGTGAAKIPTWMPVDPPRHDLPLYWVTLTAQVEGNIYTGIMWKKGTVKKGHTQRAVQVEVREVSADGDLEARVIE